MHPTLDHLNIWNVMPSDLLFFLKILLSIWGHLWFHRNFRMFSYFCEKCRWHFSRNGIGQVVCFVYYEYFINNKFSIYKQGVSFHLFLQLLSSICYIFLLNRTFNSLLNWVITTVNFWCFCKWDCYLKFSLTVF